jgi:outer membrane protein OmpA-like peptidoglycan-associated protein
VLALIGGIWAVGVLGTIARGKQVTPRWARVGRAIMAAALIASPFFVLVLPAFNGNTGVAKAFQMVSLNVPTATIDVSAANLQRLDRASTQQGLPLQVCRHADGSATLTNVRVLWHTLGNTGLVELWSEPTDPKQYSGSHRPRFQTSPYEQLFRLLGWRGLRVPLENSGLLVTTGSNLHCLELNGLHFDSNSALLSKEAGQDLARQLTTLKESLSEKKSRDGKSLERPFRLEIVGHADPRKRQSGTNEALAHQRADAVHAEVLSWVRAEAPEWLPLAITVRSEGAREQARKCEGLSPAESEACNAFNRRVVLQLSTAPAS